MCQVVKIVITKVTLKDAEWHKIKDRGEINHGPGIGQDGEKVETIGISSETIDNILLLVSKVPVFSA